MRDCDKRWGTQFLAFRYRNLHRECVQLIPFPCVSFRRCGVKSPEKSQIKGRSSALVQETSSQDFGTVLLRAESPVGQHCPLKTLCQCLDWKVYLFLHILDHVGCYYFPLIRGKSWLWTTRPGLVVLTLPLGFLAAPPMDHSHVHSREFCMCCLFPLPWKTLPPLLALTIPIPLHFSGETLFP